MKQAFFKFPGKNIAGAALLSASIFLTSFSGQATPLSSTIEILTSDKTSVQFTGSTQDALLFRVQISNEKSDHFTLTIKNETGDVLFSRSFKDSSFEKQFKVLKGEQDGGRYYFNITSDNKSLEDSYMITAETRTVNDVKINKL